VDAAPVILRGSLTVVTAMVWTLIALMGGGLVAFFVDARAGRRHLAVELRTEIGALRTELKGDLRELRTEFKGELHEMRTELKADVNGLRDEVHLLAERQAEMNGRLDVVVSMAHTHSSAAGSSG
jgi:hypothetical protein